MKPVNEQPDYHYDVFISYSSADRKWVRGELLRRIEDSGLKACIDYRDFRRGAPTVSEIEGAVKNSRKTLLVLTPAYLESRWAEFESLLPQNRDPSNRDLRLIPLLKEKCDLPTRINYLTYVDFAEPEDPILSWTQLLTALGKPPEAEAPEIETPRRWLIAHPYPMPPNFTGRVAERQMLNQWLNEDNQHPLFVLRALGGFGKSALTWHWLNYDLNKNQWQKVAWWSFYEAEASFSSFLPSVLFYLSGRDPGNMSPRQQVDELLRCLEQPGVLLMLDGFERELRAYSSMGAAYQGDEGNESDRNDRDCISPLAEAFLRGVTNPHRIRGKVLMTTRLRPSAVEVRGGILLEGCREEELTQMQPGDAVAFFRVQGVRGSRAEIEQGCEVYGFHPLSLRLLAGLVVNDLQQPGDIRACSHLDIGEDIVQRQHHVLEQSYNNLTLDRRKLLSRIACFRSPVEYKALRYLSETEDNRSADNDMRDLISRGVLQRDKRTNRYDLHPIVRRYAYDRLGSKDRTTAHQQLRDYFAVVPPPEKVEKLDDLNPAIELYHHTVRAGQYDEARKLFRDRITQPTYYQFGAYQLQIELLRTLFPQGEDHPPQLTSESDQGWTLTALANSYSLSGQPRKAVPLFEQDIRICEKQEDKKNLAIDLGNLAQSGQLPIGVLQAAEANLRRSIAVCQEIEDEFQEAVGHAELGRLLAYWGAWAEAEAEFEDALALFEKVEAIQYAGVQWAYRALRALLLARTATDGEQHQEATATALAAARRALELADEIARTRYPYERDYVRAYWLLGAAHRVSGNLYESDTHLSEALTRCRAINLVDAEADILLDLARLRVDQGRQEEALRLAQEALVITERSGYVLQGADVYLFLAEQALAQGNQQQALEHAREARRLAICDGPPDYTYKVAYEEAEALLAQLGEG